jgi:hypothetical protein
MCGEALRARQGRSAEARSTSASAIPTVWVAAAALSTRQIRSLSPDSRLNPQTCFSANYLSASESLVLVY